MTTTVTATPANRRRFVQLKQFCKKILDICADLGVQPVAYGSLVYFAYAQEKKIKVNDIDLLVPEETFAKIIPVLKKRKIKHTYAPEWHTLQVFDGKLKVELDSRDFWQPKLSKKHETFDFDGLVVDAVSLPSLIMIYKKAAKVSKDKPAENKAKYEALRDLQRGNPVMKADMRTVVEQGYDTGAYAEVYKKTDKLNALERKCMTRLYAELPKHGSILDLGCGVGVPFDKFLVTKGFALTGVDISQKHIEASRKNVPEATYIKGDFSRVRLRKASFDAIVSFYAIFHIPREEHKALFQRMHALLKDDGVILITLGFEEMKMAVDDFVGSKMAWSSYSGEKNRKLLQSCGFKILYEEEERHGGEHHLWILAQKVNT